MSEVRKFQVTPLPIDGQPVERKAVAIAHNLRGDQYIRLSAGLNWFKRDWARKLRVTPPAVENGIRELLESGRRVA